MSYKVGKGHPPIHTRFKKGQSGNPDGARKHDQLKKALKRVTSKHLKEVIETSLTGTIVELREQYESEDITALRAIITGALIKAHDKKDLDILDKIMDRLIGPAPLSFLL